MLARCRSRHWCPSHSRDSARASARMMRSRVTLAMTEAAAIEKLKPSPPTTVFDRAGQRRRDVAVDQRDVGRDPRAPRRRAHIAMRLARRMLMRSISRTLAAPTPIARAARQAHARQIPRARRGVSSFESSSRGAELAAEAAAVDDHRGGHHRAGQRPAPGLVDAADDALAASLDREIRHPTLPSPPVACAIRAAQ